MADVMVCTGHTRPIYHLQYSNIVDGSYWVISSCLDGKPMLRNGETGDWVGTFEGHKGAVWCAVLDSKAERAVTASADFSAKLWDALTGSCVHTWQHRHVVKACDFSKDGTKVLSGCQDKMLRLFDLSNYSAEPKVLSGHSETIKLAQWFDENTFFSTAGDRTLKRWDSRSLECIQSFEDPSGIITGLEISPDGNMLTVCAGKTIRFLNSSDFSEIKTMTLDVEVESATLNASKTHLIAGLANNHIRVYEYATGKEIETQKAHHGPVHVVRWAPDGSRYASGSEDGTVRIWTNTYQ